MGPQGFWGSGKNGYLFSGSWGSTGNYFRGAREQAHNLGDLGSLAKKAKIRYGKASILFDFLKNSASQTPLVNSKCIYFRTNMLIKIDLREKYGN